MGIESYKIYNQSQFVVSFSVSPLATLPPRTGLSSHHRRRLTKGTTEHLKILPAHCMDVCKETGFSVADLDLCPELQHMLSSKKLIKIKDLEAQAVIQADFNKKLEVEAELVKKLELIELKKKIAADDARAKAEEDAKLAAEAAKKDDDDIRDTPGDGMVEVDLIVGEDPADVPVEAVEVPVEAVEVPVEAPVEKVVVTEVVMKPPVEAPVEVPVEAVEVPKKNKGGRPKMTDAEKQAAAKKRKAKKKKRN